jgi:hypothetical protein
MKDLIIGCSTNYTWDTLKYWVNSINKCGFEGDKILILLNCDKDTVKKVMDSGFGVIATATDSEGNCVHQPSNIPVHVERFVHIYNFLRNNDYRYVVTTDVKDVIFQKNPIEYLENNLNDKQLVFSSESLLYEDEPWGNQNLLETFGPFFHSIFKTKEIYNVGVLAGIGYAIRDLAAMIFNMSINRPIPIVDQSTFNFMVAQQPYQATSLYTRSESGWACQLGTTADPSKIESFRPHLLEPTPKWNGNSVTTSTGKEYYIVHQYDRVPALKFLIENKYED